MGLVFGRASGKVVGRSHCFSHLNPMLQGLDTVDCDTNLQMGLPGTASDGRGRTLSVDPPPPVPALALLGKGDCFLIRSMGFFFLHVFSTTWQMYSEICRVSNATGLLWETVAESK